MKNRKVKKKIEYKNLKIVLYHYKIEDPISIQSNIEAYDQEENLLWVAENCTSGRYWEMQIDEENNTIEASGGNGMFYDIELAHGKIIKSQLRK